MRTMAGVKKVHPEEPHEIDLPGGGPHLWLMWRDPL
jgi:hypothetical protein